MGAVHISFEYSPGSSLAVAVRRNADGLLWDFGAAGFAATPGTELGALPEGTGNFTGLYDLTLATTAAWTDGDYRVTVHDTANGNLVVGVLCASVHDGDDATVFPAPGPGGSDPLASPVPGQYAPGTAGYLLGTGVPAYLTPAGLDQIHPEPGGPNARQTLQAIGAATASKVGGLGTGTVTAAGMGSAVTRITVTTDDAGNALTVVYDLTP